MTVPPSNEALTFSVVIPLYNHERYIESALRSVLNQTHKPLDIVLVDDGSSDNGLALARKVLADFPGAVVVAQENQGAHNAINRAISLSRGSHVAVLNSDDLFKPYKLERCAKLFTANPDLDLVIGRVEIIDTDGAFVERNETTEWLDRSYAFYRQCGHLPLALLNENFGVTTSNFVFTRRLWERAGGFADLRYCHDLDFLMAGARHGGLLFDERGGVHISYRVHPTNTIKETLAKVHLEIAGVIATALDSATLGLDGSVTDSSAQQVLQDVLERKGLAALVGSLVPYRRPFDDRGAFYATISGNRKLQGTAVPASTSAVPAVAAQAAVPIRAVIELSNFDRGGLEKVVLDCAIDFRRCNVEPVIVSCGSIGHLGEIARRNGIEVVALPADDREATYRKILLDRQIDIAMSHFSNVGYPVFHALGIPNITFIHNVYAMLRDKALQDFLDADKYVDRYISVSSLATEYAVIKHGIDRTKIETIPNGLIIDEHRKRLDQPPADRAQFGVRDGDYLFLNVASYNLHKSHYLMAEAMRLILRKRDDIKILCVGNVIYPPHIERLRADLQEWGLSNHMLMPGYFDDVAPLHKAADAFLLPSLLEGWSIAMNEAMYYGKPMILSETGGAPEVIVDEDIGILVPNEYGAVTNLDSHVLDRIGYDQRKFHTAPYLAQAMIRFADNREEWRRKGQRGHDKILAHFNFSDVTDRYVALCRDVIQCRK